MERIGSGENHGESDFNGFLIFGSSGAGEYLAFDMRQGLPWPVVTIDMIAGSGSAEKVAPNFDDFLSLVGVADA
jgi:hypothetical protein